MSIKYEKLNDFCFHSILLVRDSLLLSYWQIDYMLNIQISYRTVSVVGFTTTTRTKKKKKDGVRCFIYGDKPLRAWKPKIRKNSNRLIPSWNYTKEIQQDIQRIIREGKKGHVELFINVSIV